MKPYKRKDRTVLRVILSFISGAAAFIGVFALDRLLINWIAGQFTNHDLILIIKIGLWIVTFSATLGIAIFIGYVVGLLVAFLTGIAD